MKHLLNNMSEEEKNAIREQHTGGIKLKTEKFSKLLESKLGDARPLTEQMGPPTDSTKNQKQTGLGDVTGDLKGKTVNFYLDKENKGYLFTLKILNINKEEEFITIKFDASASKSASSPVVFYEFDCVRKDFRPKGIERIVYYSNNFAKELTKKVCDLSSGGIPVPAADFAQP